MDGGGRCQQSELGRLGTDRVCQCAFCTEGRIESKFGECSRCASASNREPSTSAVAAPAGSRLRGDVRANSVPVLANSVSGDADRSLVGVVSSRSFQTGQFSFLIHGNTALKWISAVISGLGLDNFISWLVINMS